MLRPALLTATLVVLVVVSAPAAERVLELDPVATSIRFTLDATMHTVHGTVPLERGTIRFDPDTGAASGEVVAAASRAGTESEGRDKKMHEKVLKSAEFPVATLMPARFEGELAPVGTSRITLHARLTLLGIPHEIAIPLEVNLEGEQVTVRGRFTVPYVDWGLKDPSVFVLRVGKEVEVEVEASGTVSDRLED